MLNSLVVGIVIDSCSCYEERSGAFLRGREEKILLPRCLRFKW